MSVGLLEKHVFNDQKGAPFGILGLVSCSCFVNSWLREGTQSFSLTLTRQTLNPAFLHGSVPRCDSATPETVGTRLLSFSLAFDTTELTEPRTYVASPY